MEKEKPYIAIKVAGFAHWIWFEREKCEETGTNFRGRNGWGDGGAATDIDVDPDEIIGRIESTELQYS